MRLSEVFRLARELMERGGGSGLICSSITYGLAVVPVKDKQRAVRVIMVRLHPSTTVFKWAEAHNLPDVGKVTASDFHEFRIRWLKELEREFKAKGD